MNQIMCRHEICSEAGLNGRFGKRHAEVRFAHAWRD
jgi:hypothetical protein